MRALLICLDSGTVKRLVAQTLLPLVYWLRPGRLRGVLKEVQVRGRIRSSNFVPAHFLRYLLSQVGGHLVLCLGVGVVEVARLREVV